ERGLEPASRPQPPHVLPLPRRLRERGRELGRRPGGDEQLVHPPQALGLLALHLVADEVAKVPGRHSSSSSSRSASRARPPRVRVLTVPSGIPSRSAISLCDSSLQ